MDIKTQRELAFFMAGIECGRMFNLMHSSTTKMGVHYETVEDDTGISISLMDGFISYEGDQEKWPNDIRHAAVRGILADAEKDSARAFEYHMELLRERAQRLNGGEQ